MKPRLFVEVFDDSDLSGGDLRKRQTEIAHRILKEKCGVDVVSYSESGRPVVSTNVDVSISHTKNRVYVGIAPKPYCIGVDVENLDRRVSDDISDKKQYSTEWCLKEAFSKACDISFVPEDISVEKKDGEYAVSYVGDKNESLERLKKIEFVSCEVKIEDGFVFGWCCVQSKLIN